MILIVDMNWKKDSLGKEEFVFPIASVVDRLEAFEIRHFSELKTENLEKYSKIILSGTALKDNEFARHKEKFKWLEKCRKPVLGICAGMEIMGLMFRGKLEKCKEIGMTDIRTVHENPLFSGKFSAYELHNYSVKASREFEVLAMSGKCGQAIKHREKPIYGVMFHPEVRNPKIIEMFISS